MSADYAHPFVYRNGELHAEDVALANVAAAHGTPCYVYSRAALTAAYQDFDAAFAAHPHLVCYAVKANPAPEIVQTLYKAGASFDVASFPEFMLVYELIRRRPARERQEFVWDKIVTRTR